MFSPNLTQAETKTTPAETTRAMESSETAETVEELVVAGDHQASTEAVEAVLAKEASAKKVTGGRSHVATSTPLSQSPVKTGQTITEISETPQKPEASEEKSGVTEEDTNSNNVDREDRHADSHVNMSVTNAANVSVEDKTSEVKKVVAQTPVTAATKLAKSLVQQMTPKTASSETAVNSGSSTTAVTPSTSGPVARNVFEDLRDPILFDSLQLCKWFSSCVYE